MYESHPPGPLCGCYVWVPSTRPTLWVVRLMWPRVHVEPRLRPRQKRCLNRFTFSRCSVWTLTNSKVQIHSCSSREYSYKYSLVLQNESLSHLQKMTGNIYSCELQCSQSLVRGPVPVHWSFGIRSNWKSVPSVFPLGIAVLLSLPQYIADFF